MADLQNENKDTSLEFENREVLTLTGIEDVISFDEASVYLVTGNGNLLIEGTGLHITTLDVSAGNMTVEVLFALCFLTTREKCQKRVDFFQRS